MNTTSSKLLSCGTIAHGFGMPMGPATTAPPQSMQMVQRGDFPKVHVHARQEIQREGDQPNPDYCVGEPESTCVEIEAHEPHDREDEHGERHMRPACVGGVGRPVSRPAFSRARRRRRPRPRRRARRTAGGRIAIVASARRTDGRRRASGSPRSSWSRRFRPSSSRHRNGRCGCRADAFSVSAAPLPCSNAANSFAYSPMPVPWSGVCGQRVTITWRVRNTHRSFASRPPGSRRP